MFTYTCTYTCSCPHAPETIFERAPTLTLDSQLANQKMMSLHARDHETPEVCLAESCPTDGSFDRLKAAHLHPTLKTFIYGSLSTSESLRPIAIQHEFSARAHEAPALCNGPPSCSVQLDHREGVNNACVDYSVQSRLLLQRVVLHTRFGFHP
jgi:hypothetical protein